MIHPTAVISGNVQIDPSAHIGPWCVLEGDITIGPRTRLMNGVSMQGRVTVGADNVFGAHAVIGTFWVIGDGESGAFVRRVLERDAGRAPDAVRAVSAAKRELLRAGAPLREWAAWSAWVRPAASRTGSDRPMIGARPMSPPALAWEAPLRSNR